jgi:hypothetical protein
MSEESPERIKYQRDALKSIIEKMYASLIGNCHRWNCGLRLNRECTCESALAMVEYEDFLHREEDFQRENSITNGMNTERY